MKSRRKHLWLVTRGVWDMRLESMPLAAGYLKAMVDSDPALAGEFDVRLFNFGGADTALDIAQRMFFGGEVPDAIGFSVLGWNFNVFGNLASVFRQLNPDGWVIFGGNHVANQAQRVFGMFPDVDVVVNGEGELTILDLLTSAAAGRARHELHDVLGISFRDADGRIVDTPPRPRIEDLDAIPSPLLTNAITLRDEQGRQRYDVVLLETNRGCPYKCSFCYWGGAIGQRLRKFSTDRIAAELDLIGYHQISEVVLCDANFGMLPEDELFVEAMIKTRERYSYPRNLETSWAKNKSRVFYSIVERMRQAGMRSSFTLALQSLAEPALDTMQRKNMKLNQWRDLAEWLRGRGLDCYAELIWGLPGETYDSFIEGYDALSKDVSRIAVYPLLLMPNTAYSKDRRRHGLVLLRGDDDDFEYVLAHDTMSFEDNKRMHKFLFWARVIAENQILRYIWTPLRELAGISQSSVLLSLDRWFEAQDDPVSRGVIACRGALVDNLDASNVAPGLRYFHNVDGVTERLMDWWTEAIAPQLGDEHRELLTEVFRYDLATRPIFGAAAGSAGELPEVTLHGTSYYVRSGHEFEFDVPAVVRAIRAGERPTPAPRPRAVTLYFQKGFDIHIDNHEFVSRYVGKTDEEIEAEHRVLASASPAVASPAVVSPSPSDYRQLRPAFDRDGVVLIRGFLPPAELDELRANLERYVRDIAPTLQDGTVIFDAASGTVRVLENLPVDPVFAEYGRNPRFMALGEALLGHPVAPAVVDEYSQFGWQAYFDVPPGASATPPHQDNYYYKFEPSETLSIWVAIDPVDADNGALRYVRGSHIEPMRAHEPGRIAGFSQVVTDFGADDEAREVSFTLSPGDAVVHHGKTIHRSGGNGTRRSRRAYSMFLRTTRCVRDEEAHAVYLESLAQHNAEFVRKG